MEQPNRNHPPVEAARAALKAGALDDATSLAHTALALANGRDADAWAVLTAAAAQAGRGGEIGRYCRNAFAAFAKETAGTASLLPRGPWRVAGLRDTATPMFQFSSQAVSIPDRPKDTLQPTAYHLSNVHILPMLGWSALTGEGHLILHGLTINPKMDIQNSTRVFPLSRPVQFHSGGNIICIGGSTNHYHFLFDYLARIIFVWAFGPLAEGWKLGVPLCYPAVAEAVELLGIPRESIVDLDPEAAHHFANVSVISNTSAFGNIHHQALHLLRRRIPRLPPAGRRTRLYLTRRDAATRRLLNECELLPLLEARGFDIVECSRLTLREQIALFATADIVVAPHGAALANLLWCEPTAKVIELLPDGMPLGHFKHLSTKLGLSYADVRAPAALTHDPRDWQTDYSLPAEALLTALDAAGIRA